MKTLLHRVVGLMPFLLIAIASPLAAPITPSVLERGIIDEMNLARTDPRQYAQQLRALLPTFRGKAMIRPGRPAVLTKEGAAAVRDAILFLEQHVPLKPLILSPGLTAAARDHARYLAGAAQVTMAVTGISRGTG